VAVFGEFGSHLAEKLSLTLLWVGLVLECADPLEYANRANGRESGFEFEFKVIGLQVDEVVVHIVLSRGSFDERESFGHRFDSDHPSRHGERARDLTPPSSKVHCQSVRLRENRLEESSATRIGDDAVKPWFARRKAVRHHGSPWLTRLHVREDRVHLACRSIAETLLSRRREALTSGFGMR
jgi:hypothetical protein